jgi:hypothetical protein
VEEAFISKCFDELMSILPNLKDGLSKILKLHLGILHEIINGVPLLHYYKFTPTYTYIYIYIL